MKTSLFVAATSVATLFSSIPVYATTSPEVLQEQFQRALLLREDGNLYAAIDDLHDILIAQPTLHRARLELAVAYYRAAEFRKAVTLAEEVLKQPDVSDEVKSVVELFLSQVAELKEADDQNRHTWSGSIGLGFGHDDNVNAGPSDDEFNVRGSILRLADDSQPKSDGLAVFTANLNHNYRMPGSYGIGERPATALWQSSFGLTRRNYFDETERNLDSISGTTGISLLSQTNWRSNINLQLEQLRLDDQSLVLFSSLNPSWTYKTQSGSEFTLRGQLLYRDYTRNIDKNRNGRRVGFGVDYAKAFASSALLQTGITVSDQNARQENQRSKAYEGYARLSYPAWEQGGLFTHIGYRVTDYDGQVPVFNKPRKDKEQRYIIGATHNFSDDWQVRASYSHTNNDSSVGNFEFKRNEVSLDLTKRF